MGQRDGWGVCPRPRRTTPQGKRVEPGGRKTEAWVACADAVQKAFKDPYSLNVDKIKNRLVW
jgi:hypothetical protein